MEMVINREWSGDIFYSHGTNTARGVAILVSSRLNASILETKGDNEERIINMTIEIDDHNINIINIYAPSTDTERQTFFSIIGEFVSDGQENIIAGDFNCIFNARLDSLVYSAYMVVFFHGMKQQIQQLNLYKRIFLNS